MNQKDQKQLKACILNDLVRGKQAHSPTKDLLKQYTPLEGILTSNVEEGFPLARQAGLHSIHPSLWKNPWHSVPPWHRMQVQLGSMPP